MADQGDDILSLFDADPTTSAPSAAALAAAMRRRRGAGDLATIVGGPFAAAGKQFTGDADRMEGHLFQAAQSRPSVALKAIEAQRAGEEADAWKNPQANALLRGAIGEFMPGLDVDENTPTPVLRNIAPMAEKFGASYSAMLARQRMKQLFDPVTKEPFLSDPMTGATFHMDGSMRTPGVPGRGLGRGGAQAPAPSPQPRPQPQGPSAPGGAAPGQTPQPGDVGPLENPRDPRLQKLGEAFKKDMDAASASSRSAFGQSANIIFRGARILPLLLQKNADGTPRMPTNQEWQDISAALVAMQTSGVPPEAMTLNMMPRDVKGTAAGIMQWLTSEPHAPDREEWVKRFTENIKREEEASTKFQTETRMQRLPSHSEFFSLFPNRAKLAAKGYGIDPNLIDQIRGGNFKPPGDAGASPAAPAVATPDDEAAKKWLEANPQHPKAEAVRAKLKAKGLL